MGREAFILSIRQSWILRHGELSDLFQVTVLVNDRAAIKSKVSYMVCHCQVLSILLSHGSYSFQSRSPPSPGQLVILGKKETLR